jgi:hypothetical protein
MLRKLLRYSLTALAILLLPVLPANAQKEQFVRSKPHVNVGSAHKWSYRAGPDHPAHHRHSNKPPPKFYLGRNDGGLQPPPPPQTLDNLIGGARIRF